jgi:glutathione S-transferase
VKIYDFFFAPIPHQLCIYLAEKAYRFRWREIPLERIDLRKGDNRDPEFLSKNPLSALPVLELGDG